MSFLTNGGSSLIKMSWSGRKLNACLISSKIPLWKQAGLVVKAEVVIPLLHNQQHKHLRFPSSSLLRKSPACFSMLCFTHPSRGMFTLAFRNKPAGFSTKSTAKKAGFSSSRKYKVNFLGYRQSARVTFLGTDTSPFSAHK